jgi:hypothetical protein
LAAACKNDLPKETPKEIAEKDTNALNNLSAAGKTVFRLVKEGVTMPYSEFSQYFVNAEDCKNLSAKSTEERQRDCFLELSKYLDTSVYYPNYLKYKNTLVEYSDLLGFDLRKLIYIDFWYEETIVKGISCVFGVVIMEYGGKYIITDPVFVKTENGWKLMYIEDKGFNWGDGIRQVKSNGEICGHYAGYNEQECVNYKEIFHEAASKGDLSIF